MIDSKVLLLGLEKSPATIVITDITGSILYVNEKFVSTTGYSKEESSGKNPRILKSGKQSSEYYSEMWNKISNGETWNGIFINKNKAGNEYIEKATVYPIYDEDKIKCYMAIKEDITEKVKSENELKESIDRFKILVDQMEYGFAVHKMLYDENGIPDNYIFLDINPAFEMMTGLSRDIIGKDVKTVLPHLSHTWVEKYGDVIISGLPLHFEDSVPELKRFYSVIAYKMSKDEFAVIVDDITERKEFENGLIENQKELSLLNENKDKFFSIIAHDLRGPFQSLVGYINLIRNTMPETHDKKLEDYMTRLYINSRYIYELLDNLLYWSKLQRNKMEFNPIPINLYEFLNDIIKTNDVSVLHKKLNLINDVDENIVVNVDENMFYSIMHNLISNSIKFTKEGKRIEIYTEILSDDVVEIGVRDEGIGISADGISKIISRKENFTISGTNKETGSGIGLVLVQEFLEYHESELEIQSNPGEGSRFYFRLPILSS